MAFPANALSLAHAIGSQFLSVFFGGSVAHSTGVNQIIDDLIATETKVGFSESSAQDSPLANTVLGSTTNGNSKWRQIINADIASAAAIVVSKLAGGGTGNRLVRTTDGTNMIMGQLLDADVAAGTLAVTKITAGAASTVLIGGASNSFSASPTVSGTVTAANHTATSAVQAGTTVKAGTKVYPGALAGASPGVQSSASLQMPYLNPSLAANTAITIASFPIGVYWLMNLTTAVMSQFTSNSISTLVDRGSDTTIQIGGADPGASSSKIWISISSGTLQIYNRYNSTQFLALMGFGAN